MFLGIEIGGTKLQLGLGRGDGEMLGLWRGTVDPAAGGEGIRRQITAAVPELLATAGVERPAVRGVGVGFGGPTDDATQSVIKSHQIAGWDGFPLGAWVAEVVGVPAVVCNDADVAGLAEALFGAGKGLSPVFYMTIGSGIGGGLIIDGDIYRGVGRGAAEIGHTYVNLSGGGEEPDTVLSLELVASGWGIANRARALVQQEWSELYGPTVIRGLPAADVTTPRIVAEARRGDRFARLILSHAVWGLSQAVHQLVVLLCPRRIVIGGGVSLIGDDLFFNPLREHVARQQFPPFAGLTDIVPAALGEEVVVHGALALARRKLGG